MIPKCVIKIFTINIMRYDINNLKRPNYYYTQEDLEFHGGNNPQYNPPQHAQAQGDEE